MRRQIIGLLAAGTLLATAVPAAAQTRPHVSGSETSRNSGATCVVNGDASACDGVSGAGTTALLPGPIIIGLGPVLAPILGDETTGRASTDTDVNRSSRKGSALAR